MVLKTGELDEIKVSPRKVEDTILALLNERDGRTICPSEVARRLSPKRWKELMQSVREVAAGLALEERLVATQKGKEVDPLSARGPIRLKKMEKRIDGGKNKGGC